ncbi:MULTISPECIES: MmcQ/YjbR family DNA-binding protein [unclassified Carboxylicivirga]|uniref:MmcQ/YjbR family DNA-binding protein n=1 Tax=Carboxylicivirga TaxID=1628153 RepID=UPI003D3502A1
MNIEEFRDYCISKPVVTECFPFDEVTLVFKVAGKIFALTSLDKDFAINLKCDPERAITLRETYPAIQPGYHMNKTHWNTINVDGSIDEDLLKELIDHSYNLIVNSLTKKARAENGL